MSSIKSLALMSSLTSLFLLASPGYSTSPLPTPTPTVDENSEEAVTLTYMSQDDFKKVEVKAVAMGEIENFLVLTWEEICGDSVEIKAVKQYDKSKIKVAVMAKKTHYNVSCGYGYEPKEVSVAFHLDMGLMTLNSIELNFLESDQTKMLFNAFSEKVVPFTGLKVDSIAPFCPPETSPGIMMSCLAMGDVITLKGFKRCDQQLGATAAKLVSVEKSNGSVETTLYIDSNLTEKSPAPDMVCKGLDPVDIKITISEGVPAGTTKANLKLVDFSTLQPEKPIRNKNLIF